MMASRRQTGSLSLLHFLLGVFLCPPEGGVPLELSPSAAQVLLKSNSTFTVVCSGWSQVTWRFPHVSQVDGVAVETEGSSSVLKLSNVTWRNSGRYTCEEASSYQSREIDIFIPGQGPEEWFVPVGPGVVMKEAEEDTIPCVVSDPRLNVSLFQRPGRTQVSMVTYEPGRGFTGRLNDTSYICTASQGEEERESQVYYVFSVIVPKELEVDLTVSGVVLKQGEVLTVNCTVKDTEMVFFSWDFPRRQEIEPITDFLPNQIRSFVNISAATVADSGVYVCVVKETRQERTVKKNITVTVLDRGYVYLWPSGDTNLSSLLHHSVQLSVQVDAHPPPTVLWTKDNNTVPSETSAISTTHLTGSRYVSTLTLVRVQMDQTGSYTATASNDDDVQEVEFNLEVKAPPRITSLSEFGSKAVKCVSEGSPPPSVTWYTCHSSNRCSNITGGWRSQSAASGGGAVQENITEERGVAQVHSVLTLHSLTSVSAVRCEAKNSAGRRARDLRVVSTSLLSQVAVLAAVLVLVVLAVVFLIILIFLWRKKPRYEGRWRVIELVNANGQHTFLDPAHLPYHPTWEVPRENIALGQVLGSGAFGRVVEATVSGLLNSHSSTKAAVKMVKQGSGASQSLMSELKVLVHLGPHLNIVNLLGACTRGGPVYLITEFCCHGDLVNYLQRNKHTFLQSDTQGRSDCDGGYMDMNKDDSFQYEAMKQLNYADIEPAVYETPYTSPDETENQQGASPVLSDSSLLSLNDLLSFSFQISQAMDFLSSRNCVHRDLAARNILVCEGKLVKVCDFGLARDLKKDQDYVSRGNNFLPLKWMSPESLYNNVYSSQSDVWAYGVLLWEIFSLGESPYSDLPMTQEFLCALKRGYRLSRPDHAPLNVFDMMKQCWEDKPESRPSFSSLVVSMGNMLTEDYKKRYQQLSEEFLSSETAAVVRARTAGAHGENDTHESPVSQVSPHLLEVGSQEAGPSQGTYIIPITDITIETNSGAALDADSPQVSDSPSDMPVAQELTSSTDEQEAEVPPSSSCKNEEEEESCL